MQKYFLCSFFFVLVLDNDVRPVGFDFFIGLNRHVPEDIHFLFLFLVYACTTCPPVDVVNFADIRVGVMGADFAYSGQPLVMWSMVSSQRLLIIMIIIMIMI